MGCSQSQGHIVWKCPRSLSATPTMAILTAVVPVLTTTMVPLTVTKAGWSWK